MSSSFNQFPASQFDESDSDESCVPGSFALKSDVFVSSGGHELPCIIHGRVVNHGSRLVSKYTVQLRNGSTQVVSARDVYWPSPIAKNNAASTAPQDSGKTKGRAKKPKILSSSSSSEASESDKKRSYKRKHADQRKKSSKKRKPNSSSSSDSSDASSDSDSSQAKHKKASRSEQKRSKKSDKTRMREAAFKPDEDEAKPIWMQLASNVPYLHSRRSVAGIWKFHLNELHKEGIALDCKKPKTFTAWATKMCQQRCTFRRDESRANGTGEVEPYTAWDEVTAKWEASKLAGAKTKNPLAAQIMRDSATSTANCLDAVTLRIIEASKKYKTKCALENDNDGDGSTSPEVHPSTASKATSEVAAVFSPTNTTNTSSTRTLSRSASASNADSRNQFNSTLDMLHNANKKDDLILRQLMSMFQPQQMPATSSVPVASSVQHESFVAELQQAGDQYVSLHSYASRIVEALGISSLAEFAFITLDDVGLVKLPALQQRMLVALAKANNVGSKAEQQ
jgi:hypothetical protein